MVKVDKEQVINTWIKNCMEPDAYDECCWALEIVDEAVRNDPDEGWSWIKELVNNCPNDRVLANIAAGPLEDLMKRNAEEFIDRIETLARQSPDFRKCLTGVWGISPWDIYQRVVALTQSVNDPL